MKILIDNCVDVKFAALIHGHDVKHCLDLQWDKLSNGKLMDAMETAGFDVMVTTDTSIGRQQNMSKRKLCLITSRAKSQRYESIAPLAELLMTHLSDGVTPGTEIVLRQ